MKNVSLWILLLTLLAAPSAHAADAGDLAAEIVYRTNLGRAADVKLLIGQGASPNQADGKGTPVLALAAARKDGEGINVMKALLAAGADVNAKDALGKSALFHAAGQGNKESVLYLLEQGIRYYDTDVTGNIARTTAFNAGHNDIVALMDKFVNEQTEKVGREYKDYNEAIEKQYQAAAEEELRRQQAEEAARKEALAVETAKPDAREIDKAMHGLALESCTFQYWSFCQRVKQRSDLSAGEIAAAVATHKSNVLSALTSAVDSHRLDSKYVDSISNNAKARIEGQLSATPSATYRFEHGICKKKDAEERCNDIAITWDQAPPPPKKSGMDPYGENYSGVGIPPLGGKHQGRKTYAPKAAPKAAAPTPSDPNQQFNDIYKDIYRQPAPSQQR